VQHARPKKIKMPSKGVQVYTYVAAPGCSIELSVPGQTVVKDQLRQFWNGDLEVDSSKIDSFFDKTGRFVFKVLHEGILVTEQWVEVNALTGSIVSATSPRVHIEATQAVIPSQFTSATSCIAPMRQPEVHRRRLTQLEYQGEGTMTTIANTHSVIHPDPPVIVSYGFYEAGHGHDILPNRHQCYITVTPNYSDWLGQVAPIGSPQRDQPFRRLGKQLLDIISNLNASGTVISHL
jgi:hypothetical protein